MKLSEAKHYLPFVQAAAEGKVIQISRHLNPTDYIWEDASNCDFSAPPNCYRIKPTPKLRPWKPEEVPVGAVVTRKMFLRANEYRIYTIISLIPIVDGYKIVLSSPCAHDNLSLQSFVDNEWVHSLDHGKTWLPCGVMEE